MKRSIFLLIFLLFLLSSCVTLRFGQSGSLYLDNDDEKRVRELDLSYSYKVVGVTVQGTKSIPERSFIHPDGKTLFLCISFPKIGILTSHDYGKTYQSQFFKISYLDKIYGYDKEDEEEDKNKQLDSNNLPKRFFYHFAASKNNPSKIVLSMGPYLFISHDRGTSWEMKSLFLDTENTRIHDIIVSDKDEIIIFSNKKLAYSTDWGKSWTKSNIILNKEKLYKFNFISASYDNELKRLYASFKYNNEHDAHLSKMSYNYFIHNKNSLNKSGLFYSEDNGKTWTKTEINIPVILWNYKKNVYAGPIYPLALYSKKYNEDFTNNEIYRNANLDVNPYGLKECIDILLSMESEDYQIISRKENRIIKLAKSKPVIIEETNFENLYQAIIKLQYLDVIQWKDLWHEDKKSNNFHYEFNPLRIFKLWTGMRTNSPILYTYKNNTYYRIKPHPDFIKVLITYSIEKQREINSKNPFFRKKTDREFFPPELDPTHGLPIIIEVSKDQGETWQTLYKTEYVRSIIDPLGNKRSGFYWYKNIDQKKMFKLQLSFGFEEGASFMSYPDSLTVLQNDLLLGMNYFSIIKSYKDMYLLPTDGIIIKNK